MANQLYQNQKKAMAFSKNQVSKAGRKLRKGADGAEEVDAIQKIQDFRSSHSYPLMLIKNHIWRTARKVEPSVIIARRLKRLPTILDKLRRPTLDGKTANSLDVTRMQDIGGCRAIFEKQSAVYSLLRKLRSSKTVHKIIRCDDYISRPKKSGYRGVHLVYSCYEKSEGNEDVEWKGHKIEVQIRSQYQHAWSTAIELVDLYEGTQLKTSDEGDQEWREFFHALAYTMSIVERSLELPDDKRTASALVDTDDPELKAERIQMYKECLARVKRIGAKLNVIDKLTGYTMALDSLADKGKKNGIYVLAIYREEDKYKGILRWFKDKDRDEAIELYDKYELDDEVYQTVLVGAQGAGSLTQAYPNFFADASRIITIIGACMNEEVPPLMSSRIIK